MTNLLTSPWFWTYYVASGIAAVVLDAREAGRMTVGEAIPCFLFGFMLTPLCLLVMLRTGFGERFKALMAKEIWRRK